MQSIERRAIAVLGLVLCVAAPVAAAAETVSKVPIGDPAMNAAFAKAHATLDEFLAKLAHPTPGTERYAVKLGLKDNPAGGFMIIPPGGDRYVEYFWIGDIQPDKNGSGFVGFVHNDPEIVRNVTYNQKIHFVRDDIADWTYYDHGKVKGNFTACPALEHAPTEKAEMRDKFGLVCD